MELDWSTFLLEIANFLVLAWLLDRFLFRPVMRVIGERQSALDATVERTHDKERAAQHLVDDYGQRLEHWEKEKDELRQALHEELRVERERRLVQLNADLEEERLRQQAVAQKAARESELRIETTAVGQAASFAAQLLRRVAGPALEAKLIESAIEDLRSIDDARRTEIDEAMQENGCAVHVTTAYPLSDEARAMLESALGRLGRGTPTFDYRHDADVIAGVRVSIGPWTLRANLADELRAFSDAAGIAR